MNIIFHYPKEQNDRDILSDEIAEIHAKAVTTYLNQLPCTKEQKIKLLEAIIDSVG